MQRAPLPTSRNKTLPKKTRFSESEFDKHFLSKIGKGQRCMNSRNKKTNVLGLVRSVFVIQKTFVKKG